VGGGVSTEDEQSSSSSNSIDVTIVIFELVSREDEESDSGYVSAGIAAPSGATVRGKLDVVRDNLDSAPPASFG
jgi:hypothetical protein